MENQLKFPDGFYWGAATSSHQIEGDNHNDWSEWEKSSQRIEQLRKEGKASSDFISGKACDSYRRYEEDFDIAQKLNHNIHRFSIEWSRIEPEEGKFNQEAIDHYKRLIDALRKRGIEPIVTLWHFTNPIWFSVKGGFLNKKSPEYFTRYVKYVVDNLRNEVGLWITFNEATTVCAGMSYLKGIWPPQHKSIFEFLRVRKNFLKAHILAYQEIKKIYKERDKSNVSSPPSDTSHNVRVGLVENNPVFIYGKFAQFFGIGKVFNRFWNRWFFSRALPYYDFIGLNYYTIKRFGKSYRILPKQDVAEEMDWEIYPRGIYTVLKSLKKLKKPIFITENGIADSNDLKREKYIKDHLYWVKEAINEGVDVHGYLYWSLLDNFEWHHGFSPRFGLVEINYTTFERKIRPSALAYTVICKNNSL